MDILMKMRNLLDVKGRLKRRYKISKFRKNAQLGKNVEISPRADCVVSKPGRITIGDNCTIIGRLEVQGDGEIRIGNNSCVYHDSIVGSVASIRIGDCVGISNHVHIYDNNNHPTDPVERRKMILGGFGGEAHSWIHSKSAPIVIEDDAWIGEYSAILKGVTIGRGAIVASHAVVTKDVPPYTIVAGNPARVVKKIDHEE